MAGSNDTNKSSGSSSASKSPASGESSDIELIKSQLDRLREDFAQLGDLVGTTAKQRLASAKEQATANAEMAREQAVDQFTATLNETEAQVRRNPLTALAVVLGIGYILGAVSRK